GIILGSHINDMNLDHPDFHPIYEKAEELDAAIFVHPWDMPWRTQPFWAGWLVGMPAETSKTIGDLIFGGIMDTFPKLRFAFAHCGGSFAGTIGRIEHGFNVRPDLFPARDRNPRNYLGKFYVDTLTADPVALRYNMSIFGEDSVLLGSDYPFPLGEHHPGLMVENMDLTDETKQAILADNVYRWLGIKR
ncbi:MAG: amidohydrolase family protein, partial [Candidatus Kariarchaeaceae archaeon]